MWTIKTKSNHKRNDVSINNQSFRSIYLYGVFFILSFALLAGCGKEAECYKAYQTCVDACDAALDTARDTWRDCKEQSKIQLQADLLQCRELQGQELSDCILLAYRSDAQRKEACTQALADAVQASQECRKACGDQYNECVN